MASRMTRTATVGPILRQMVLLAHQRGRTVRRIMRETGLRRDQVQAIIGGHQGHQGRERTAGRGCRP